MAIPHAKSGEVIEIGPLGPALAQTKTTTLMKTKTLEIIRLVIPSGKDIPEPVSYTHLTLPTIYSV